MSRGPPSQMIRRLALDRSNRVARQQAGLPLNKSLWVLALVPKMVSVAEPDEVAEAKTSIIALPLPCL